MMKEGEKIGWLRLIDDMARMHVKIAKLNDPLAGFCFIRDIDRRFHTQTPEPQD
jgi:hypothetical protein